MAQAAKFKARFEKLGFYVNGERKKFENFIYNATKKAEIEVLEALRWVERIDEPKKAEDAPKDEKPSAK